MARYLLVANQTAESDELVATARNLASEDSQAEFVLLVPATPASHLVVREDGDTIDIARRRAVAASARLEAEGLRVADVRTGDQDPGAAVADELQAGSRYAAIVVCTLPAGVSRWLRMDAVGRLTRNFPRHRVIHVVARQPVAGRR